MQPLRLGKTAEQRKDLSMGFLDGIETAIFPQFVPVSDLDVGKPLIEVVAQSVQKKRFVSAESICTAVVAAVSVAEKDQARRIIKRYRECSLKYHIKPAMC